MDLWELVGGARVKLKGDVIAEVILPTEDGAWIQVRYLKAPGTFGLVGTEDLCGANEILGPA